MNRRARQLLLTVAVAACGFGPREAVAHVTLPAVLGDHMVLQQQSEVVLWGRSDRRQEVAVVTSWDDRRYAAQPDAEGRWRVRVRTPKAGGPFEIVIDDGDRLTLRDVLVGEVWLASGQSNMEFKLSRSAGGERAEAEADLPAIRYFDVARQIAAEPQDDAPGSAWVAASPGTAGAFSAVAFHFARELHRRMGVRVGIVQASWGGTPAEAWTPRPALQRDPRLRIALERWEEWERNSVRAGDDEAKTLALYMTSRPHREPGVLFGGMIAPVAPFRVKGFLWYQGESNVRWAGEYAHLLTTMVGSWREWWRRELHDRPDLPFYIVQLPPHGYAEMDSASRVREAQQAVADAAGHAGLVATVDLGDMEDIHPTRKREVGERLAWLALARTYGFRGIPYSGPVPTRAVAEGGRIRVTFDHAYGGLRSGDAALAGFEISSRSRPSAFREASAQIEDGTVVVWHEDVPDPGEVRYGWGDQIARSTLLNGAGLPAAPFRRHAVPEAGSRTEATGGGARES